MLQPGQQLGPFTIEKEIGAGAMGAVYRGVYPKTGQKVAIKVMLPGAAENRNTAERFRREVEILKQLNHPNIVKILGDGKHQGQRFYAMEYIQGESLDRALSRRGRLSWEEVVQLGQQLCQALQHAHEKGVIHRDLKPSNLMLIPDGTLKLTDFGIAKDLDVTQLTEANCTVGTASYMSPEQCRGERDLTHKSDLYSLGIVLYELLTGRKPFTADNVMDMFMLHVKGSFERPSRVVADIPKWLDILVCQLLEKKPEQRPRDAAMVGEALNEVLEKVEARESAGLEAARKRKAPGEVRDEQDREAASALVTGKKRKKKKAEAAPAWYQRTWLKAVLLLLPLLAIGVILWFVFQPPSADKLYARIEKRMKSSDRKDWEIAYTGPIQEYIRRYGKNKDDRTQQVFAWDEQVGILLAEDEVIDAAEKTKTVKLESMDALSKAARKAVEAILAENQGKLTEAARIWTEVARDHRGDPGYWARLADRRLSFQLAGVQKAQQRLQELLRYLEDHAQEPSLSDDIEKKAFTARRFEEVGDLSEARVRWQDLKDELSRNQAARSWFLLAASRVADISAKSDPKQRLDLLRDRLAETEKLASNNDTLRQAEVRCLHLMALYTTPPFKEEVGEAARKIFERIQAQRTGKTQ